MAEIEKVWRLLRRKGVRPALVALGSIIAIGIANNLTQGAVTSGATYIREKLDPSTFILSYSEPLAPKPSISISRIETGEPIKVRSAEEDAAVVASGAGNYRVKLMRTRGSTSEVLPILVSVKARDEMVRLETGDEHWASTAALAQDGDRSYAATPSASLLSDTRWLTSPTDAGQADRAATPLGKRIVIAGLAEVGLWEKGTQAERVRIAGYWIGSGIGNFPGTEPGSLTLPWGGALLGHIVRVAGAAAPSAGASFPSWLHWGDAIPIGSEAPGDVLVFSASALPEARSRLLAAVLLRRRADCLEVIAGNIADRVVITCVHRPILATRRAVPASTQSVEVGE